MIVIILILRKPKYSDINSYVIMVNGSKENINVSKEALDGRVWNSDH